MYVHDTSPSIGEHANFDFFRFFSKLWIAISLKFSPSTVLTGSRGRGGVGAGVVTKLCKWEFLVTRKNMSENIDFLRFSRKRCGIFALRLRNFTEVKRLYGMAENFFWFFFRQRALNVFIGVFLKVRWRFLRGCRGYHLRRSVEEWLPHSSITFLK